LAGNWSIGPLFGDRLVPENALPHPTFVPENALPHPTFVPENALPHPTFVHAFLLQV
jgi:hypothetical protein